MSKTPVNNAFYEDLGERWLHAQDDPVALLRAEGEVKHAWVEERLRDRFGARPLRVLDVGCGAGFLVRRLAAQGHSVHGLDYSLGSLNVSRRAEDPSTPARYLRGDALRLPFANGSFDVVASMDFLEHVEDPAAAIREAARVLKPGGLFFFHTFNRNPLAWLVIIKGLEWFVRNTPDHMHVLRLFIKPAELERYARSVGLAPFAWTGLRPDFRRRAFWKMLATGKVPGDFTFVRTPSLLLSYLGVAEKTGTGLQDRPFSADST
jgi:2-polyprenyl-6-hydroxyphenyl methylase/3-demethylubiquinone-9 3-methyltransferase